MEEQGLALLDYGPDEPAGALEDLRHSPVAVCTAADQFGLHALSRRPLRRIGEEASGHLPLVLQGGQSCAQDGSGSIRTWTRAAVTAEKRSSKASGRVSPPRAARLDSSASSAAWASP